jgi:hypothetical protein
MANIYEFTIGKVYPAEGNKPINVLDENKNRYYVWSKDCTFLPMLHVGARLVAELGEQEEYNGKHKWKLIKVKYQDGYTPPASPAGPSGPGSPGSKPGGGGSPNTSTDVSVNENARNRSIAFQSIFANICEYMKGKDNAVFADVMTCLPLALAQYEAFTAGKPVAVTATPQSGLAPSAPSGPTSAPADSEYDPFADE